MSAQSPTPGSGAGGSEQAPGPQGPDPAPGTPATYNAAPPVKGAKPCQYPPYPPYSTEPQQASVREVITGGRTIRYEYKSRPPLPSKSPPKPALPRGPKVTDVKMTRRQYLAHARCLRRHGAVLTDRLERMSRPPRRRIIYMWRDYAGVLPAETIARFRNMLDADVPFKPDQAYQYFMNLKKSKKKPKCPTPLQKCLKLKKMDVYGDKKCEWARNATVAFARGIQHKLGRPGCYSLEDGMLNLSNIVMCEIAKFIHMKPVHRRCTHPKAKFLMELSDKIAVWIDQVMLESDERMLMMDVDEDDEVLEYYQEATTSPDMDKKEKKVTLSSEVSKVPGSPISGSAPSLPPGAVPGTPGSPPGAVPGTPGTVPRTVPGTPGSPPGTVPGTPSSPSGTVPGTPGSPSGTMPKTPPGTAQQSQGPASPK